MNEELQGILCTSNTVIEIQSDRSITCHSQTLKLFRFIDVIVNIHTINCILFVIKNAR